ncbi:MAG TPA: FAD-dependent oxidoreductase [Longimicrobiaceae bacterium]
MRPTSLLPLILLLFCALPAGAQVHEADVVVVGGTPGGIMAAIAAAREGRSVVLLERTRHIGGLPANGLGATDIATRGATRGLFLEFVGRIRAHYALTYGEGSAQLRDASDGYHFEPSVAEGVFQAMLEETPGVRVLLMRQFDADPGNVGVDGGRLTTVFVTDRSTGAREEYRAGVFIDATYEGDLAAAAGAPYRLGRESAAEFSEPMAGRLYKQWNGPIGPGSTGLGDNAVQAYNFRLALTNRPEIRVPVSRPAGYDREEYVSLVDDLLRNRVAAPADAQRGERDWNGIGRIVNMVRLPNGKTDANNQHAAFISTDLPEENWPWPTSGWEWRDRFAERLREYTLGLIWFAQNDPALPEDFRRRASEWGLSRDEYEDNDNFPRQVYVREGRRIVGEYLFTAHDALPAPGAERPPVHATSVTASHYALDSHAVRKREPGRVHLDGFFSLRNQPYTIPYGVMVPRGVDGLLTPVPVSGTHVGFSTMRMEPAWMALGQAAGIAASRAVETGAPVRGVEIEPLQDRLIAAGAVLIFYRDAAPGDPHYRALQHFGLRGLVPGWEARLGEVAAGEDAARWIAAAGGAPPPAYRPGATTRGELLEMLLPALLDRSGASVSVSPVR